MANTTIDSLELEIQANASQAASGVDSLVQSLESLKNATKGVTSRLSAISKRLISLNDALKGVSSNSSSLKKVSDSMKDVSTASTGTNSALNKIQTSTERLEKANTGLTRSYADIYAKFRMVMGAARVVSRVLSSCITESNEYIEAMNLFNVSMGEYAEEAAKYATEVGEIVGIDPAEWMRNQGVFNTIIKGFGNAGDKAAYMSKNLTQLGYDIASFYNLSVDNAMQKLGSGIAGELEPLRRLGWDLSVARLQQEAYTLGIQKSVSAMTQAEKSQLRYYAIMTQVKDVQGDWARTLTSPANQLRVISAQVTQCARAIGNLFIPVLNLVMPYLIAFAKLIRYIISLIAKFFRLELPEVDWGGAASGASSIGGAMEDVADNTKAATKEAKKLKNALLGIDELNIISEPEAPDAGGLGDGIGALGGDLGIDLPGYDFLAELAESRVNEIFEKMKEHLDDILEGALAIGAVFATWKIANGVLKFMEWLSTMKGYSSIFSVGFKIAGLGLFLDSWNTIKEAIHDIRANGANFTNVTKLISGFAEGFAASFMILGKIKLAGVFLIITGITGILSDISDMAKNDINWENATSLIKNLGLFLAGIGFTFGNLKLGGKGLVISGVSLILQNLKELINGFSSGDFSNVNWVEVAAGALMIISGLIFVFKKVNQFKSIATTAETAAGTLTEATKPIQTVGDTMKNTMTPKLEQLAVNLGLGLVIIGEVALAAMMIVGTIYILGLELKAVGDAWKPVIDNGETVVTALLAGAAILGVVGFITASLGQNGATLAANMLIGTGVLFLAGVATAVFIAEVWAIGWGLSKVAEAWQPVIAQGDTVATAIGVGAALLLAVGAVTAGLGYLTTATGGTLPIAIGVGTAMLIELGVATGLFIAEVWAIGKGLDEVGRAWQPVIDNGETIATGIETASALLLGIGVVTAALGVLTVASAGLLPVAIGLGTALLVELSAAVIAFIDSIVAVAKSLKEDLSPELQELNEVLPPLTTNMSNFVDFMSDFAGEVVRYSEASAIAGLAGTIDTIIGWFTQDPIDKMSADAEKIAGQAKTLNEKLNIANPELETASTLLTNYVGFITQLGELSGAGANVQLADGLKANLKDVGSGIVVGFADGIKSERDSLNGAVEMFGTSLETSFKNAVSKTDTSEAAKSLVQGFATSLNNSSGLSRSAVSNWATNIKKWFSNSAYGDISRTRWETYAKQIIQGFSNGITANYTMSQSAITTWASNIKNWFGGSMLYVDFHNLAKQVIDGFNYGLNIYWNTTLPYISLWAQKAIERFKREMDINSPSRVFRAIGENTVEGYNQGIENEIPSTLKTMNTWANSFTGISPRVSIDSSALAYANKQAMSQAMSGEVIGSYSHTVNTDGFADSMESFYREYVEPTLKDIASDTKRQADKAEVTNVRIGNRDITNAVVEQRKANGYSFA